MITLINPPSPFLINDRVFPSLGILYIASVLEKKHKINFLDLACEKDWEEKVKNINSDFVCITGTSPHYSILKRISEIIRKNSINTKLIIGGPHATISPNSLTPYFDTVVLNEGEDVIEEALFTKEKIIDGGLVQDLNTIPFPNRNFINLSNYNFLIDGKPSAHILTSRGCPYRCAYCCAVSHKKLRFRSVENVLEEIELIKSKYNIDRFMFFDDTFTLNKKLVKSLCEKLKFMNIRWRCFVRSDKVDKETLALMKEAGCAEIGVGVESGSQNILDIVNKNTKVEDNTNLVKLCKEVGILFKAFIIIGLPGETEKTVEETRKWLLDNRPDKYSIFVFSPYPGSPIGDHPEKFDIQFTVDYDKLWWGGTQKDQVSLSRTSALSSERIIELRNNLLLELKQVGMDDLNNKI